MGNAFILLLSCFCFSFRYRLTYHKAIVILIVIIRLCMICAILNPFVPIPFFIQLVGLDSLVLVANPKSKSAFPLRIHT